MWVIYGITGKIKQLIDEFVIDTEDVRGEGIKAGMFKIKSNLMLILLICYMFN